MYNCKNYNAEGNKVFPRTGTHLKTYMFYMVCEAVTFDKQ